MVKTTNQVSLTPDPPDLPDLEDLVTPGGQTIYVVKGAMQTR